MKKYSMAYWFISKPVIVSMIILCAVIAITAHFLYSAMPAWAESPVTWEGNVIDSNPLAAIYRVKISGKLTLDFRGNNNFLSRGRAISPYSVRPGDRMTVTFIPGSDKPEKVVVKGDFFSEELLFINNQKLILADGRQINLAANPLLLRNGKRVTMKEMLTGLRVFVRVDPVTKLAGTVESVDTRATRETVAGLAINSITVAPLAGKGKNDLAFVRGQGIAVQVNATAGKKVFFDVAGIGRDIPMKEQKPGIYKGTFMFNRGDARRSYVMIRVQDKNQELMRIYPNSIDVASTPPEITPRSPEPGSRIGDRRPIIFAGFYSHGSMILPNSATIYLDGKPVETGLEKNVAFVKGEVTRQLSPGTHTVKVVVEDEAGNRGGESWNFTYTP